MGFHFPGALQFPTNPILPNRQGVLTPTRSCCLSRRFQQIRFYPIGRGSCYFIPRNGAQVSNKSDFTQSVGKKEKVVRGILASVVGVSNKSDFTQSVGSLVKVKLKPQLICFQQIRFYPIGREFVSEGRPKKGYSHQIDAILKSLQIENRKIENKSSNPLLYITSTRSDETIIV